MFGAIVSKIASIVRSTIRAVGAAMHTAPWLTTAIILALFVAW